MDKPLPWVVAFVAFCAVVMFVFHTFVAPAINMGSGIFHYYWPILIAGFLFTVTRKPITDIWA